MSLRYRSGIALPSIPWRRYVGARWYRALGLGGMNSALRLVLGFVSIKVTALYLGPSGLALVAQLGGFITICHGVLGSGIGSAAARIYPEFREDHAQRRRFLATAWRLGTLFAATALVAITLGSDPLARWLLTSGAHRVPMALAGLAVACLILSTVIVNTMNGAGEMGRVVISHAIAALAGFAIYVPASMAWGLTGGLVGYALSQAIAFPVSLLVLRSSRRVTYRDFHGAFDRPQARRIARFVPMLIAHAGMVPLSLILIRGMVARDLDLDTAGIWQAMWRLSEVYMGVIMSAVSLYFLPRLGEVIGTRGLREEIVRTFARSVGAVAVIAFTIFLFRDTVVHLVFTSKFAPMRELMPFQLLGDAIKMAAWTFGFVLVALVRSRWYIALEILVPLIYFGVASMLVPRYGVQAVPWAYCFSAVVHLSLSTVALRDILLRGGDRAR